VDTAGRRIVCDAEETACLRQRGVSATWWARHVACLLHARHHFTKPAATDGSLKINEDDGRRRVAYGVWEGVQPIDKHKSAALEEAGILETDYNTHRRVGDGISGGALPPSWEVIDFELYAIYAYLRRRVEVMKAMGATQRCLILSGCKAALEAIEQEYRGQTLHNADRRTLLTAIHAQLTALRRKEGYAIFLWTPGHGGVAIAASIFMFSSGSSSIQDDVFDIHVLVWMWRS